VRAEFSETWCYELLRRARWPNGITCPYCGRSRVTTHSKSARSPRRKYLCISCRRTFTDLTGTPLARTNLPLATWFRSLRLFGGGWSRSELAKELGVKWDTMGHMERRLALALARPGLVRQLRDATREARGA
jgi:transposase-like protein